MLGRPSRALAGCAVAAAIASLAPAVRAQPEAQPAPQPPEAAAPPPATPAPAAAPPWSEQPGQAPPQRTAPGEPRVKPPARIAIVPDYPNFGATTPAIAKVRANPAMMHWGMAMTVGGLLVTIAGAVITASSIDVVDIYCDGPAVCAHRDDTVKKGIGSTMLVGGAALGAIGFPMWLFGGRMVPVKNTGWSASLRPDLKLGPGSGKISFAF
jgi:hypothetical protein